MHKNIKTIKETDLDSDHLLVGCWMKVKFKKMTNCRLMKRYIYNIDKFGDKRMCEKYKCKADNTLKENQENNVTINEVWEKFKKIVCDASVEVFNRIVVSYGRHK